MKIPPKQQKWLRDVNEIESYQKAGLPITATGNATRYSEGDTVSTPQGIGVVMDVQTSPFKDPNEEEIEATEDSPVYAVLVEDARVGVGFYRASEIHSTNIETDVDNPEEDVAEMAANSESTTLMDHFAGYLSGNQDGRFQWPESWRKSDTPARVIAMKAFAGMNGSFDGCVREMRGNISRPEAFCGDFIDRLVGNPYWRGDSWAPGD